MDTSNINSLLEKYLQGISTLEENALLETWYMRYENKSLAEVSDEARMQQLERVRLELVQHSTKAKTSKLWTGIAVAAAAVAAIVFGIWFYTSRHLDDRRDLLTNTNDIAPGGNKATLSVNGKTIQLSEDKTGVIVGNDLKYNDGTELGSFANNEAAIKNITASTPRGGMYQITLPDGSRAWMNADTKISFPAQFIGKERKILLSGEAYFEVAKNKEKPFIVESEGQQVEVLGTHFNISAYKGEGIKTTLLEGSVKVMQRNSGLALPGTTLPNNEGVVLKPNQQAILSDNGIKCIQVDPSLAIAWKNGLFAYKNASLEYVMQQISRWYNVDVVYETQDLKERQLTGSVSRYDQVSGILKVIENTGEAHFKIEGKKIVVMQ